MRSCSSLRARFFSNPPRIGIPNALAAVPKPSSDEQPTLMTPTSRTPIMALRIPSLTTVRAAHFIFLRVVLLMAIGSKGLASRIGRSRALLDEVLSVSGTGTDDVMTLLPCGLYARHVYKALSVPIGRCVVLRISVVAFLDFPVVAARIAELPSSIDEVLIAVRPPDVWPDASLPDALFPAPSVPRTESPNRVEVVSAVLGVGGLRAIASEARCQCVLRIASSYTRVASLLLPTYAGTRNGISPSGHVTLTSKPSPSLSGKWSVDFALDRSKEHPFELRRG